MGRSRLRSFAAVAIRLGVIAGAVMISFYVATKTPLYANPDEAYHLAAFEWYQGHFAPPAPDFGATPYQPHGVSRVYSAEMVYHLFGCVGRVWSGIGGAPPPSRLYRVLNALLLAIVLIVILFWKSRFVALKAAGVLVAGIPQVLYIFGYANSDGFATAVAAIAVVVGLRELERPSGYSWVIVGLTTGMVLASKQTAWPVAGLAWIAVAFAGAASSVSAFSFRGRVVRVVGVAAVAVAVAGPFHLAPRLAAGENWGEAQERMLLHRSMPGYHPLKPTAVGFHLRRQGEPITEVVLDGRWWLLLAKSTWGVFGHMNTFAPTGIYRAASCGLFLLMIHNLILVRSLRETRRITVLVLVVAAATMTLQVAATIGYSWVDDWQPQGRYLLSMAPLLAIVIVGAVPSTVGLLRPALLFAHLVLGWGVTWKLVGSIPPI